MNVVVETVEDLNESTRTVWFRPAVRLRYQPGQFIELQLPDDALETHHKKRWFTLSSSPTEELLAITTRITTGSPFKRSLADLQSGDTATMSEPMGDFVLPRRLSRPLLFVAGGIGITPVRSMLRYMKDIGENRDVSVLYAVAQTQDLIFFDLIEAVAKKITTLISSDGQRLSADTICHEVSGMDNPLVYLSGPEAMVEVLFKQLRQTLPATQLVTDYFPGYPPL